MGSSPNVNAFFGIMTMIIAVPTGVKVFNWIFTMYGGRVRYETPMLWTLGFMLMFVLGGISGVLLAIPPVNYVTHNTTFLVAHFHNMIIPGVLFGYLAGYMYWFPKVFGFRLDHKWGVRSFWCWIIGFLLAFMPLYATGLMGMPRRMSHYFNAELQPMLILAFVGAVLILLGIVCLAVQLWVSVKHRDKAADNTGDPWDGRTLEWSIPSPPPEYNFARIPRVSDRDAFSEWKQAGCKADGSDYAPIAVPENSMLGVYLGAVAFAFGFAMIWQIWWLAILCGLAIVGGLIVRSFVADEQILIPAEVVAQADQARTQDIAKQGGPA